MNDIITRYRARRALARQHRNPYLAPDPNEWFYSAVIVLFVSLIILILIF